MTDTAAPAPSQTVVVAQPAASPRWIAIVGAIVGIITSVGLIVGTLLTLGAWRSSVDLSINELKKRMEKAEANQSTYIPVLIGLSKDVTFLADRARREDDRRDREQRH